jgi:hypothetical protein
MHKILFSIFFSIFLLKTVTASDYEQLIKAIDGDQRITVHGFLIDASQVKVFLDTPVIGRALWYSAKNNNLPLVEMALKFNPDQSWINRSLVIAAECASLAIVDKLLLLNSCADSAELALLTAAVNDRILIVQRLLKADLSKDAIARVAKKIKEHAVEMHELFLDFELTEPTHIRSKKSL